MYSIKAPAVYIHERALKDPRCVKRMERMMNGIKAEQPPKVVNDTELNRLSGELNWCGEMSGGKRTGQLKRSGDPIIIFNSFRWVNDAEMTNLKRAYPSLSCGYLLGDGAFTFSNGRATLESQYGVCQDAHLLHSAWGCLHICDYCNIGTFLNIMLDMEEFVKRLDDLVAANPWQQLYKYDNHTDIPAFEPEYGALKLLVDYFAKQKNRYLLIYTKSDNLAYLADYDHRGQTIVCWTLSCDTVSRQIEKKSPPTERRIAAARLCQEAGYTVRARLSPIIPIHNWREENSDMLAKYLSSVRPDVLTVDMFKHIDPRKVREMFDVSFWDEEFLGYIDKFAAMAPSERPRDIIPNGKQLFPHSARAKVYRFFIERIKSLSPATRVALCGETPDMWAELGPELGMDPSNYVCACGPTSVPGNPFLRG
ncbi:MAG: radical SAM protein [Planctomycetota bacterium]